MKAGPESVWPKKGNPISVGLDPAWPSDKKTHGWGNYFPPPLLLHAERYLFCIQEKTNNKMQTMRGRRVTWRGGGGALLVWLLCWQCCGGDRWRCRGSQTAAPSSGAVVSSGSVLPVIIPLSSRFCVKIFSPL